MKVLICLAISTIIVIIVAACKPVSYNSLAFIWHVVYSLKERKMLSWSTDFRLSGPSFAPLSILRPVHFQLPQRWQMVLQVNDQCPNTFWCGAKRKMAWYITALLAWMDQLVTLCCFLKSFSIYSYEKGTHFGWCWGIKAWIILPTSFGCTAGK